MNVTLATIISKTIFFIINVIHIMSIIKLRMQIFTYRSLQLLVTSPVSRNQTESYGFK